MPKKPVDLEQEKAISQVLRWQSLDFFPTEKPGRMELTKALTKFCKTPEHIRETVDYFAEMASKCPTPHDIREFAASQDWFAPPTSRLKELREKSAADPCPKCDNDGRVVKESWKLDPLNRGHPACPADPEHNIPAIPAKPPGRCWRSWVEYCHCSIGQVLKNLQQAAARKEAA